MGDGTIFDQPGAAVAADVEEDMCLALAIAGDEQRYAETIMGDAGVAVGQQRRRAEHDRMSAKQTVLFAGEMIGAGVDARRQPADHGRRRGARGGGHRFGERQLPGGRLAEGHMDVHGRKLTPVAGGCKYKHPLPRAGEGWRYFAIGVIATFS